MIRVLEQNLNFGVKIFFGIAKGAGAVTDVLATVAMCIFLRSSKTGMNRCVINFTDATKKY